MDKGLGAVALMHYSGSSPDALETVVAALCTRRRSRAIVYRSAQPTSAPELILALRRLIDAIIDGTATREPSTTLDTVYATIDYLAAAEGLCPGCGRPLVGPHGDLCPGRTVQH